MTASLLPAATRPITVRPAPRREPPFDDELPPPPDGTVRSLRLAGPVDPPLPFEQWPPAEVSASPASRRRAWIAPAPPDRGDLPDPGSAARRLLVALLEVRAGQRPLRQLGAYLSPAVLLGLQTELARVPGPAGNGRSAVLKSVHVCEPADAIAEISAVICSGSRHRAIAARLEGSGGRWRCVRMQLG
jgi:hypothetical protein